jgi:hypothetical protein
MTGKNGPLLGVRNSFPLWKEGGGGSPGKVGKMIQKSALIKIYLGPPSVSSILVVSRPQIRKALAYESVTPIPRVKIAVISVHWPLSAGVPPVVALVLAVEC